MLSHPSASCVSETLSLSMRLSERTRLLHTLMHVLATAYVVLEVYDFSQALILFSLTNGHTMSLRIVYT